MWKIICGAVIASTFQVTAVTAQQDYYAGKRIDLVVGFNPGGTYDLYSRIASEWLPRYIPGNPTIVVQNMPGAGGTLSANFLYAAAPQDGLTIGMFGQAAALQQVTDKQGVSYDVREFNWIGRLAPEVEVTVVWNASTDVRSIEDAQATAVALGATSAGSTSDMMPRVMNAIAGTQFETVLGYQGTTGAVYAMEQGEVDGAHSTATTITTQHGAWLTDGQATVLVQYAGDRHSDFPDVPAMTEFGTTDEDKKILGLFASTAVTGRSLVAPPNVPADRLTILQTAFSEMVADPAFQTELQSRELPFGPMSGEELEAILESAVEVDEAVTERVLTILGTNGG